MSASGTFSLGLRSEGPRDTLRLAKELGKRLKGGEVVALQGGLGSGKTVFVKGLALGLKVREPSQVRSPTFALIQEHPGSPPLCHADLYRVTSGEALNLGLEEYWQAGLWVTAVEWADRALKLIPSSALWIEFEVLDPKARRLTVRGQSAWKPLLIEWKRKIQK